MRILMIAYYFPPDSSSGSFRPFYFANYLSEIGEKIYVLTAKEEDYLPAQPRDYGMLKKVRKEIEIIRTKVFRPREALINFRDSLLKKNKNHPDLKSKKKEESSSASQPGKKRNSFFQELKDTITDCLSTPDPHIGWLPFAVREGKRIIDAQKIDLIYATGGPWTGLLVGAILRKITGKPLVMDFRDPWTANPGFLVRSRFIRFIETFMERKVIFFADKIVTNTEELKQDFLTRFPALKAENVLAIPNGFEEYISNPVCSSAFRRYKKFTLTHAGALYFSRNPKYLIQAAINLIERGKIEKDELRLIFLGGISISDPDLEKILAHPYLKDVIESLPRLPYQDALLYQEESDVLFLLQPDFPLQVPRKLYDYMTFLKPVLGITNSEGATARIIKENHLGLVASNKTSEIELALEFFYEKWKKGTLDQLSLSHCNKFLNKNLALQLRNTFYEIM